MILIFSADLSLLVTDHVCPKILAQVLYEDIMIL